VKDAVFSREELDQMMAPIALYPDELLAQVLMASTYPGNVADAVTWSRAHPEAKGDSAVRMVADQPWDPSVQSLVAFPQALAILGQDPGWVQRMGDAFLAQPDDVMDAVQRLRRQAQDAGNLATNEYQKVSTEQPPPEVIAAAQSAPPVDNGMGAMVAAPAPAPVIVIESAQPDTVYVPSYNPTQVYGDWAYPSYPPPYYPPSAAYYPMGGALMRGLAFGTGIAIADSLWGDTDWWDNDININSSRYNNINVNRNISGNGNTWRHDPVHRDGVPYRDNVNREQFNRQLDGRDQRAQFRGEDAQRTRQREQARNSMQQRGVHQPARSNAEARQSARDVENRTAQNRAGADRAASADRVNARQQQQRAGGSQAQRAQAQSRQQPQRAHQSQSNTAARNAARQQNQARGGGRNNAFQGASQPRQAQAQAQRGRQSHASAQRPQSQRGGGGQQVHRQAQAPRQQHQASRGGSRPPSGGGRPAGGQPSGGGRRR
jgi:hypothetical protein